MSDLKRIEFYKKGIIAKHKYNNSQEWLHNHKHNQTREDHIKASKLRGQRFNWNPYTKNSFESKLWNLGFMLKILTLFVKDPLTFKVKKIKIKPELEALSHIK